MVRLYHIQKILRWYLFIATLSATNINLVHGSCCTFSNLVIYQIFHWQVIISEKHFVQTFCTLKNGWLIIPAIHQTPRDWRSILKNQHVYLMKYTCSDSKLLRSLLRKIYRENGIPEYHKSAHTSKFRIKNCVEVNYHACGIYK